MHYLDFDLSIEDKGNGEYQVAVVHSPGGEANELVRLPSDREKLADQIECLRRTLAIGPHHRDVQARPARGTESRQMAGLMFGRNLFDDFFVRGIRNVYEVSLSKARQEANQGLRLRLRTKSPDLA